MTELVFQGDGDLASLLNSLSHRITEFTGDFYKIDGAWYVVDGDELLLMRDLAGFAITDTPHREYRTDNDD